MAEALVLKQMLKVEAGSERSVPVFGGDLNQHLVVHHAGQKVLHVAHSANSEEGKRIAVGCMRHLLSCGLGAPGIGAGGHMARCHTDNWCITALLSLVLHQFRLQHLHMLMCR